MSDKAEVRTRQRIRIGVLLRSQSQCEYCGLRFTNEKDYRFTVEHVIPRFWGGRYSVHNLVAACKDCNTRRGNLNIAEFTGKANAERIQKRLAEPVDWDRVNEMCGGEPAYWLRAREKAQVAQNEVGYTSAITK